MKTQNNATKNAQLLITLKHYKKNAKKNAEKGESCILVYDSRMIKPKDKQEMENIVKEIPNCYLVDYEDFVEKLKEEPDLSFQDLSKSFNVASSYKQSKFIKQSYFIKDIDTNITYNSETDALSSSLQRFTIGNLVDCMRILLLLHPGKLKKLASEKNKNKKNLNDKDYTLLYNDFNMIQKEDLTPLNERQQKDNDKQIREKSFVL